MPPTLLSIKRKTPILFFSFSFLSRARTWVLGLLVYLVNRARIIISTAQKLKFIVVMLKFTVVKTKVYCSYAKIYCSRQDTKKRERKAPPWVTVNGLL